MAMPNLTLAYARETSVNRAIIRLSVAVRQVNNVIQTVAFGFKLRSHGTRTTFIYWIICYLYYI